MNNLQKSLIILGTMLLLGACVFGAPVPLAWDRPTKLVDGTPIPTNMLSHLVTTLYAAPKSDAPVWTAKMVLTNATMADLDLPLGEWLISATVSFPGSAASARSALVGTAAYGKVVTMPATKLKVLVISR